MDETAQDLGPCVCCGRPAILVCEGCKQESLGRLVAWFSMRYCSASCQEKDWPSHKRACEEHQAARKHLEEQARELRSRDIQPGEPHPAHHTYQTLVQPDVSSHLCIGCKKQATHACGGCKGVPDAIKGDVATPYYCNVTCNFANWFSHREGCLAVQARQKLYEAGEALQKKYYGYCLGKVMSMMEAGTLTHKHMILYERDSVQHTTSAMTLLQKATINIEEDQAYLACLVGSVNTDDMGIAVKDYIRGKISTNPGTSRAQ